MKKTHRYVFLGGKGKAVALVDWDDFDRLMEHSWYLDSKGYAITKIKGEDGKWHTVLMHRLLINPAKGMDIDHINGKPLDNRQSNLRVCTRSENLRNQGKRKDNTSGFKGVYWNKQKNKWIVHISIDSKQIYLGLFTDLIEAAKAYDTAALKYHGSFAHLNFSPQSANTDIESSILFPVAL